MSVSGGAHIFSAARREVLDQLQHEIFPDFKVSSQFRELVAGIVPAGGTKVRH